MARQLTVTEAMAREAIKRKRLAEQEQKRKAREAAQRAREESRAAALKTKEDKQRYLEARQQEVEDLNAALEERVKALRSILQHTLAVNDTIAFESLRITEAPPPFLPPVELSAPAKAPGKETFTGSIKPPTFIEKTLRSGRYEREMKAAEQQYASAVTAYEAGEVERRRKLDELKVQHEAEIQAFELKKAQRNAEVDELERLYRDNDVNAITTYNMMVLERSQYPEGLPQEFKLAYLPDPKELVIEYELPDVGIVPEAAEYRYVKAKDSIESKPRKPGEVKDIYQDVVASITLRTIHEVLEADQQGHIQVVTFSGFVRTVDRATGNDIEPHIISVRVIREGFTSINLGRVDKFACLRNLSARVSPEPQELLPVKPVVEFNMVDKRFVEQGDVLSDIELRPNLMELKPSEFETLVANLFQKMGLETKLTRSTKDGGVDAVAFDPRPVLGGKVVIQAKRYKNTVEVSAVRDLYGTMMNEGASKGIIVTTSSYGKDAYEFCKDKPVELIDGGGLLYMLEQHAGIRAKIVMPTE